MHAVQDDIAIIRHQAVLNCIFSMMASLFSDLLREVYISSFGYGSTSDDYYDAVEVDNITETGIPSAVQSNQNARARGWSL